MYRKIEQRMTSMEAEVLYPDEYILMRRDSMDLSNDMGCMLYVGDSRSELLKLIMSMENPDNCGVIEGVNLQRSLGIIAESK